MQSLLFANIVMKSTLQSYHKRDTEIDILLAFGEDQTQSMGMGPSP